MENSPYISIIVVGRNDNYGYKFLERFQNFLNNIQYLAEKFNLESELIVVEWNPPSDKKRLYEELILKKERKFLKIRFIEFPEKIHKKIKNAKKIPLFEYLGKNVGIKRAKGNFVLITNPDVIFSEELFIFLSKKNLDKKRLYRADRFNLHGDIPKDLSEKQVIKYCEKNWKGCLSTRWGRYRKGIKITNDILKMILREIIKNSKKYRYLKLSGGAPGDFMLISKEGWNKFRGFPEMKVQSGMDGYACAIAFVSGFEISVLKERIYHQTHGTKEVIGRPFYKKDEFQEDVRKMLKNKKPIEYNKEDWGFINYNLDEKEF